MIRCCRIVLLLVWLCVLLVWWKLFRLIRVSVSGWVCWVVWVSLCFSSLLKLWWLSVLVRGLVWISLEILCSFCFSLVMCVLVCLILWCVLFRWLCVCRVCFWIWLVFCSIF